MEGGKRKEPKSAVRIRKRFITELTIRLQDVARGDVPGSQKSSERWKCNTDAV